MPRENRDGARFCRECGATFAAVCAGCGAKVEAGSKFCDSCGAPLATTPVQPTAAPRFVSPESYTPKHLAEKILTSKSALEGERKQVTVLFADLKGSMELLADRDPEEARRLLDPVVERMMEAVHHYEGTVNQVMGDGIMALFGAPLAHEDHAVRGCYAAVRMQRRVALYADEIQRAGGTPVQIRVGLNSGEVVVRAIGSDLRMDYTAVGQTTHLAARMEQMAKPGSALITGETLNLAEGYVQVRPLGAVPVKGMETPTPVYELTGIVPARSRFQASAARGLTRFVGRDRELQQLAQALDRAGAGHGQAVAVVGEAGLGKSRLVWEFTRSHRTHGWLVLESGSVSYGKATPYLPVIDLLKAYCGIQERDDPRAIRERVAGKLLMLDRALEPLLTSDRARRAARPSRRPGRVAEKAVDYLRRAGLEAAARSALPDARAWFEQALGVLEALPESQATLEQAFETRLELRPVLHELGEVRRSLERTREAETIAERLNDDRRRGRVYAFVTTAQNDLGELDDALETGTRALAVAGRLGDVRLRILTTTYLGETHYYRGEYERVVELATDNLAAQPAEWVYEYFGSAVLPSVFDRAPHWPCSRPMRYTCSATSRPIPAASTPSAARFTTARH